MINNYRLTFILLCGLYSTSFAQDGDRNSDWQKVASAHHQKGGGLTGGGLTIVGAQAKLGKFVANRTWIGLEGEVHNFFSQRQEAGLFARYYLWNGGFVSGFSEIGFSYGRFKDWVWDLDLGSEPPKPFYSPKLNAGFGLEYTLGKRFSLEGVAKAGKLTQVNWIQPSFQGSVNFYFGR
ncbi:hypothetical protein [Spirosoma agri]|uniref:Porin family protein n=1 Tax=Spirosoma agri TaxID=1987381 RepID=A0A6M0IQ54_9BACT|nr:hypothetical protein [Spirosoma agri]NEU70408.1 hypothetical protein [Spirosoma agri]